MNIISIQPLLPLRDRWSSSSLGSLGTTRNHVGVGIEESIETQKGISIWQSEPSFFSLPLKACVFTERLLALFSFTPVFTSSSLKSFAFWRRLLLALSSFTSFLFQTTCSRYILHVMLPLRFRLLKESHASLKYFVSKAEEHANHKHYSWCFHSCFLDVLIQLHFSLILHLLHRLWLPQVTSLNPQFFIHR